MSVLFDAIANTISMASSSEEMKRHVEGFVRTNRGSYIEGLNDLNSTIDFLYTVSSSAVEVSHDDVNAECSGAARAPARYFRFDIPEGFNGMESVVLLEDLSEEELSTVRVRQGSHGVEFYSASPEAFSEKPVDHGWIIVGPSEAGLVVWTWYPGRMTAGSPLEKHAVKLNS